jgi:ABC-2 type transport system permease protein
VKSVWRHARAEARRVFRDPGALLILVAAVFLYSFFYPIPYLPQVLREVPVAVVDHDRTPLSRQIVRMADAHSLLKVAERPESLGEAEGLVLAGRVGGILVVPEGFERDVQLGRRARVGVFADASYFLVYRQVATGFLETVGTLSAGIDIRRLEARGRTEAAARAGRDPVPLLVRPLFNPTEGYASYVVPAVLVLILQQTLLIGIGLLGGTAAEARRSLRWQTGGSPGASAEDLSSGVTSGGTQVASSHDLSSRGAPLESGDEGSAIPADPSGPGESKSLRMTGPLSRLLGRTLFYLALYSVYSILVFTVVYRLYGFPERSRTLDLSLFALPFLLACIFLALTLSRLFTRRETALQVLLFTSLPSVFLAGFAWPLEAVPAWLRAVSLLVPSTTGIAGFLRLTEMGAELRHVRFEWLVLWALAAAYFLLAWVAERRSGPRVTRRGR